MRLIKEIGYKQAGWEYYFVACWHFYLLEIAFFLKIVWWIYFKLVSSIRPIPCSRPSAPSLQVKFPMSKPISNNPLKMGGIN
jgi:hypothetical protein